MSAHAEVLRRGKVYPLADRPTLREQRELGSVRQFGFDLAAIWTGEKRPPRKGEWYLSGSPIEAWRAPNDLTEAYHIAELVRTVTVPERLAVVQRKGDTCDSL